MADTVFVGSYFFNDPREQSGHLPPRRSLEIAQQHMPNRGDVQYIYEYDIDTGVAVRVWKREERPDGRGGWVWDPWTPVD